jgi:hypothetical protein
VIKAGAKPKDLGGPPPPEADTSTESLVVGAGADVDAEVGGDENGEGEVAVEVVHDPPPEGGSEDDLEVRCSASVFVISY